VAKGIVEPPSGMELVGLVADFLEQDVYPAQDDMRLRLRVRIASNALRLVERELQRADTMEIDEDGYAVTSAVIAKAGSLRSLTSKLRDGELSLLEPETYELVRAHVEAKLRIAAPEILTGDN
jgi:Domain of unknown function (DUF6285)